MENKPQVKRRGSLTIPQDIPPTISALDSVDHTKED